jgi:hypothetical protein
MASNGTLNLVKEAGGWYALSLLTINGWGEPGDVPVLGRR